MFSLLGCCLIDVSPDVGAHGQDLIADTFQFRGTVIAFHILGITGYRIAEPVQGQIVSFDKMLQDTVTFTFGNAESLSGELNKVWNILGVQLGISMFRNKSN